MYDIILGNSQPRNGPKFYDVAIKAANPGEQFTQKIWVPFNCDRVEVRNLAIGSSGATAYTNIVTTLPISGRSFDTRRGAPSIISWTMDSSVTWSISTSFKLGEQLINAPYTFRFLDFANNPYSYTGTISFTLRFFSA